MSSLVGKLTGADKAGKRAAEAMRAAGDKAQYKPWDVSGSYFGDADFDFNNNTASYNLSPELEQLRDVFMDKALGGPDTGNIMDAEYIRDTGKGMFTDAYNRDVSKMGGEYFTDMQSMMAPGRAKSEQRLANNLFASGRMGAGSAAFEGGGYLNPERMEYLTAMNREDNAMAFDAQSRAKQEQMQDMSAGLGYYGMGNQMRLDPYNDMYSLFGMGSGVEQTGQQPLAMGQALGSAAQPGNNAQAQMYGMGAQSRLASDLSTAGMFTKLIGAAAGSAGGWSGGGSGGGGYGMPGSGTPSYGTTDFWKGRPS
tara:strand:- start:327 stop:1256 length:930 start_codon:yes stop_codon:yes gene_type:complete